MATDSNTTSNAADVADVGNQVASNLAAADDAAGVRVQTLAWAHQARAAQLSRASASLKAQFGAKDPRVKEAEDAATAANGAAAQVAAVHRQVTTPDPQVAANGWALHGRVFDAQLAPASSYAVFLVDSAKTYQQAYGFAYTDDTGYFLLNYAGPDSASSGKTRSAAGKTPSQSATASELFIEVVDTKARPVFLSPSAFQPIVGSATYQTIVLPADRRPIGDPPPEIRQVAIPKNRKNKKPGSQSDS